MEVKPIIRRGNENSEEKKKSQGTLIHVLLMTKWS